MDSPKETARMAIVVNCMIYEMVLSWPIFEHGIVVWVGRSSSSLGVKAQDAVTT